ncbi:hypothetical protein MuYL_1939 [Mucilaginibacter xinganensis]|uniref:Uncharacterized protein n=1 Tax=Mucilaginibacter xinganensis TaxID=1234841 RepID=A0A223NVD4_9SPHI|nr:hypothetical protein MuYL_1939 [Mucilaginibacter xinganensis]
MFGQLSGSLSYIKNNKSYRIVIAFVFCSSYSYIIDPLNQTL